MHVNTALLAIIFYAIMCLQMDFMCNHMDLRKFRLRLVAGFPPWRPGFDPGSGQVGFVVDKVALGRDFSEYFGFLCQSSFHQILHHHNHPG
jgi:hypothetical protein